MPRKGQPADFIGMRTARIIPWSDLPQGAERAETRASPSPAKELTSTDDGSAAKPAGAAQPVRQAATPQAADSERAETRASGRQEERAQSSRRSKRAAQRETANQQSVARRNAATVSRWRRAEDRASNWRRDRYDDYPRDGDRRFRAARDDDFLMGRAERHEGPLMMVPSVRYRW